MSDLNLVWAISHGSDLKEKLRREINCVLVGNIEGLSAETQLPSVVIFDPDDRSGEECRHQLAALQGLVPGVPILAISSRAEKDLVLEILDAGAGGFLLKSVSDMRLHEALLEIIAGESPLSSKIASILIKSLLPSFRVDDIFNLKEQEIELLQLLSQGMTKKEISRKFNKSIHTIDNHVRQIYSKMKVNNLGEAVGEAFRKGVIS